MAATQISGGAMEALKSGSDVLFILLGGIMVLAMHSGFAFLELGTVRKKSQVNALVKILTDFSVSTIAYFFVGYSIAYGVNFFAGAETLVAEEWLRADQVLLSADLRGGDPGHRFGRHRRAGQVLPATGGDLPDRRLHLPALRRDRLESGFRRPGLAEGHLWRGVP
jgi:hypothetical protein